MSLVGGTLAVIVGGTVAEIVVVLTQPRDRQNRLLPTLFGGLAIVTAWIASRAGAGTMVVLMILALSLAAHLTDVWRRW